jgi:transposase InsO family protein
MARTVLRGRDGGNVVLPPDYLKDYASVPELEAGLHAYFRFYNLERPHQSLAYRTPAEVHLA